MKAHPFCAAGGNLRDDAKYGGVFGLLWGAHQVDCRVFSRILISWVSHSALVGVKALDLGVVLCLN